MRNGLRNRLAALAINFDGPARLDRTVVNHGRTDRATCVASFGHSDVVNEILHLPAQDNPVVVCSKQRRLNPHLRIQGQHLSNISIINTRELSNIVDEDRFAIGAARGADDLNNG